jgi:hypothetical protein
MPSPNLFHVKTTLPIPAAHSLIRSVMVKANGFCMHETNETNEANGTATVEYFIVWSLELDPPRYTWRIAKPTELVAVPA